LYRFLFLLSALSSPGGGRREIQQRLSRLEREGEVEVRMLLLIALVDLCAAHRARERPIFIALQSSRRLIFDSVITKGVACRGIACRGVEVERPLSRLRRVGLVKVRQSFCVRSFFFLSQQRAQKHPSCVSIVASSHRQRAHELTLAKMHADITHIEFDCNHHTRIATAPDSQQSI